MGAVDVHEGSTVPPVARRFFNAMCGRLLVLLVLVVFVVVLVFVVVILRGGPERSRGG
jgi:hypothetical protein